MVWDITNGTANGTEIVEAFCVEFVLYIECTKQPYYYLAHTYFFPDILYSDSFLGKGVLFSTHHLLPESS